MTEQKCIAEAYGGNWCIERCLEPKDCSAKPRRKVSDLIRPLRAVGKGGSGDVNLLAVRAADEIERLILENWQLKGALGYEIPGDILPGDFKCGLCDAKSKELAIAYNCQTCGTPLGRNCPRCQRAWES